MGRRRRDTVFKWIRWSNPIHERILILFRDNLSPFWLNILSLYTDKNFALLLIRFRLVFLGLFPSLFFFSSSRRSAQRKLDGYTWLLKFYSKLFPERGLTPQPRGLIDSVPLRLAFNVPRPIAAKPMSRDFHGIPEQPLLIPLARILQEVD